MGNAAFMVGSLSSCSRFTLPAITCVCADRNPTLFEFANVTQRGIRVAAAHVTSGRFLSADFGSVSVIDRLSRGSGNG